MVMSDDERIVLLDEQYRPIGVAPKLASHHDKTPLHLAFSCYVFNEKGELLVTQRALTKKVWPGVWTNSFCGHPAPDEAMEDAIRRRGAFELGIHDLSDLQCALPNYRYVTPPFDGIIENEFCPVYVAHCSQTPQANPDEVETWKWMSWDAFREELATRPDDYSYWVKEQVELLNNFVRENIIYIEKD